MKQSIAYFSMEIGLNQDIPTYSGGLGILAGDTIKSAADLSIPMVAVTLLYHKGYFNQSFTSDHIQQSQETLWNPKDHLQLLPNRVTVEIEGRTVHLQAWQYQVKGVKGHKVPVIFLDSRLPENSQYDQTLTDNLYGGDHWYRLCQEIVLGIGGLRMLKNLGLDITKYHMNEGHAAFLVLELNRLYRDLMNKTSCDHECVISIKKNCVFTTHTPVPAGHDMFELEWVHRALGPEYSIDNLNCLQNDKLNMTLLAMNHSAYTNGVAKKHGEVSSRMFPGYEINAITNGVHATTWVCPPFQDLFDQYIEGWREDNFMLRYSLNIPDRDVWHAHETAKSALIDYINQYTDTPFKKDVLTIGFARRFAVYKRADLIFYDIDRLIKISQSVGELQIVMAGKAHPHDNQGIDKLKYILDLMSTQKNNIRLVFLPSYEINVAKLLVSGSDIWLNTPMRPYEASGTSGMKATLNGVLNFSVLDGWWIEGWVENVTGWAIGPMPTNMIADDASQDDEDLYEKLKHKIIPTYYQDRAHWIYMMKHSISHNGAFFNTQRMVSQYLTNSWMV